MASSSRKTTSYSSTSASNLDNNLDALLDDLQTSISPSRPAATQHYGTTRQPQGSSTRIIETSSSNSRRSPLRATSPLRSASPGAQGRTTTIEKYVSTGPAGTPSGIPGLEMLDRELQDVQPGQSKTVAYKQVSYHYDKKQEGNDLEPWIKTDKISSRNDASIVDDFCERTFEKSNTSSSLMRESPDYAKSGKEISNAQIYKADVSTKTIPTVQPPLTSSELRSTERDFKYLKETRTHTEPSPISPRKNIKTVRTDETEELTNVEYLPPSTPIPASLQPGPNTKVTTTIKTYTYELPGAPENYIPPASSTTTSVTKNVNVDKSISYSLPPQTRESEKTVSYHVEDQRNNVREYVPPPSPSTNRVHREEKVYMEQRRAYRAPSPPPSVTSTTVTRNEQYIQQSGSLQRPPPQPTIDVPDHVSRTERVERVYQSEAAPPRAAPPPTVESTHKTVRQYEEHISGSRPPVYQPPVENHHSSSTRVYQYDEQSTMPRPFPTNNDTARVPPPSAQPPRRIEDLMASFSESEEKHEIYEKRDGRTTHIPVRKDFEPSSVKNVAGPPVYYPPGSGDFHRKEEHMHVAKGGGGWGLSKEESMGMSKAGGEWAKERANWEYGAHDKKEEKVKTKKAVVPVCLPLCCALPCVIM